MRLGTVAVGGNAGRHARDFGVCIVLVAVFLGVPFVTAPSSLPSLLLVCLGPLLVCWVIGAQVTGHRDIDRWRVFLFGLFVSLEALLLTVMMLATGSETIGMFGYGFALLAGVAAVLS